MADRFPAFDLAAQLRYWAGPRCCRNLRRLTVSWGACAAQKTDRLSPQYSIDTQSDQANRFRSNDLQPAAAKRNCIA